jgi:membrane-associated protease RseP (regulator of RpoE activity)
MSYSALQPESATLGSSGKDNKAEKEEPVAKAHLGWEVQVANSTVNVSQDLSEQEEQECLLILERKKAEKKNHALQKSSHHSQANTKKQEKRRPSPLTHFHDSLSSSTFQHSAASMVSVVSEAVLKPEGPAVGSPTPTVLQTKPVRKFRVLPAVVSSQHSATSPQTSINEPRILGVKKVQIQDCQTAAMSPVQGITSPENHPVLSPFSAFYRDTTNMRQESNVKEGNTNGVLLDESPAHGHEDSAAHIKEGVLQISPVAGNSCPEDQSVHFCTESLIAPANSESTEQQHVRAVQDNTVAYTVDKQASADVCPAKQVLSDSSSPSATSILKTQSKDGCKSWREVSLAPRAQRIWPLHDEQFSTFPGRHGDNSISTIVDRQGHNSTSTSSDGSVLEFVQKGAVASVLTKSVDGTEPHILSKTAKKNPPIVADDQSKVEMSEVRGKLSPKANSWSGVGLKLEPINSSTMPYQGAALLGCLEVVNVQEAGPAEKAGIQIGDVIAHISNGVLAKGTSAMEATTILRENSGPYHIFVSRRRTSMEKAESNTRASSQPKYKDAAGDSNRKMLALLMQPNSSTDAAFSTDLSSGFTLRDGKDGKECWASLPMVSDLIGGSSAHQSGLRIGDVLIGVGSLQVDKIPSRASISLLQGEAGSKVLIGIYPQVLFANERHTAFTVHG